MGVFDKLFGEAKPEDNTLSKEFQSCVRQGYVAKLGPEVGNEKDAYRVATPEQKQEIQAACKVSVNAFKP